MKKALVLSSMVGSLLVPVVLMVPKLGFLALFIFFGVTLATSSSTVIGLFFVFFLSFFSAGGITPAELFIAF
ncbi:MAG: hypothetical protein HY650_12495 [Acidobacteria bacterium]|nr:hypothetical protein [Acidobacteriota bacterium]